MDIGLLDAGLTDAVRRRGFRAPTVERGASLPLLALVLAVLLMVTSVVVGLSTRVLDRAQAQSAADAAALAGVVEGRDGAERFAVANGGELVVFEESDNAVRVVVVVDGWKAEARAERRLERLSRERGLGEVTN